MPQNSTGFIQTRDAAQGREEARRGALSRQAFPGVSGLYRHAYSDQGGVVEAGAGLVLRHGLLGASI